MLDVDTGEQVAEYEANCPVYLFSQALAQIGLYYNTALIAPRATTTAVRSWTSSTCGSIARIFIDAR